MSLCEVGLCVFCKISLWMAVLLDRWLLGMLGALFAEAWRVAMLCRFLDFEEDLGRVTSLKLAEGFLRNEESLIILRRSAMWLQRSAFLCSRAAFSIRSV